MATLIPQEVELEEIKTLQEEPEPFYSQRTVLTLGIAASVIITVALLVIYTVYLHRMRKSFYRKQDKQYDANSKEDLELFKSHSIKRQSTIVKNRPNQKLQAVPRARRAVSLIPLP